MIKGLATIEKIDITTNEIIDKYEEENDICYPILENFFLRLENGYDYFHLSPKTPLTGNNANFWFIAYGTKKFKQSMLNISFPYSATVKTIPGYPIYEVGILPSDKDKVTFIADILPPATGSTRTIECLGVGDNRIGTFTNLQLSTPCVQNDSTVVRVTYRLYFDRIDQTKPLKNINQHLLERIKTIMYDRLMGTAANYNSVVGYYKYYGYTTSLYYTPTKLVSPNISFNNLGISQSSDSMYLSDKGLTASTADGTEVERYLQTLRITDKSFPSTDIPSMGCFFRSMTLHSRVNEIGNGISHNNFTYTYRDIFDSTTTPLQNIFKLKNNAPGPFQNISFIGTMLGNINVNVNAYDKYIFPKMFRLNITQSGDINTAQYKYEELKFTAGFVNNSYCPRVATLQQEPKYEQTQLYFRKKLNERRSIPSTDIVSGILTIRSADKDRFVYVADCTRVNNFITCLDVYTGDKYIIDSSNNLNVTNVSDLTASNGKIYVTCASTGVWEITGSPITTLTITQLSGGILPVGGAYQIDSKNDGTVLVLLEGNLAISNPSISSWTLFNTTTNPQFQATGITDNKWSNVVGMTVDPDNINDRILFLLGNTTGNGYVWWSRGGSNSISDTIYPTTVPSVAYTKTFANILKRSDSIRCVNGRWLENPSINTLSSSTMTMYNYGWASTNLTSIGLSYSSYTRSMKAIPAVVNGVKGVFIGNADDNGGGCSFFIKDTSLPTLTSSFAYTSNNIEFFTRFGSNNLSTDMRLYYNRAVGDNEFPLIYLENSNIMLFYEYELNTYSTMPLVIDPSVVNYNLYKDACWKSYGWNSSTNSWELGNTNSKPVHSGLEVLNNGITVSFSENAGSGTQFLNDERFIFIVGEGLMKDNATSYTFSYNTTFFPNELITEFSSGNISQPGLLTDEPLTFSKRTPNTQVTEFDFLQNKGLITGRATSTQLIAEQVIPSNTNFDLRFRFSNLSYTSSDYYFTITTFSSGTTFNSILYFRLDSNNKLVIYDSYNSTVLYTSTTTITIDTDISIVRSTTINPNKLSIRINNTEVYLTTTTHSGTLYPCVNLGNVYGPAFNNCRITYTENRSILKVGNSVSLTGSYNNKFLSLPTSAKLNEAQIKVGGLDFTVVTKHPAETIGSTEVNLASGAGWLVFSGNHVGTVTGSVVCYYTPDYV